MAKNKLLLSKIEHRFNQFDIARLKREDIINGLLNIVSDCLSNHEYSVLPTEKQKELISDYIQNVDRQEILNKYNIGETTFYKILHLDNFKELKQANLENKIKKVQEFYFACRSKKLTKEKFGLSDPTFRKYMRFDI